MVLILQYVLPVTLESRKNDNSFNNHPELLDGDDEATAEEQLFAAGAGVFLYKIKLQLRRFLCFRKVCKP